MSNEPMAVSDYDAFGEAFAKTRRGMGWPEIERFVSRLETVPNFRVLDVGCWSGRLLETLSETGADFEYVGIDSSRVLVSAAKSAFPGHDFAIGDMRSVSNIPEVLSKAPFDAVFAIASFHHLLTREDRREALSEFSKVLAKNGELCMTNWNLLSESNVSKYGKYRDAQWNFRIPFSGKPRTYAALNEGMLETELAECGWEIVESGKNERNLVTVARFRGAR